MADSRRLLLSLIDKILDDVRSAAAETKSLGRVVAHICHIDIGDAQSAAVYLKERGFSGHADRLARDVGGLLQKTDEFHGPFVAEPTDDDQKQEKRYLRALRSEAHRLFRFLHELRSLVDEDGEVTDSAVALGGGKFVVGHHPISLEGRQRFVLDALVDLRTASMPQLLERSGVDDVARQLKKICERFPQLAAHITLPGGRGKGGYSTTIRKGD